MIMTTRKGIATHARRKARFLQATAALIILATGAIQANAADGYKEVRRLGTSQAICKPGVETPAELQAYFAENPDAARAILQDANWEGDPQVVLDAIAEGRFTEKSYQPGTKLEWMGLRDKSGAAKAGPKRIWAGKEAFIGYELEVVHGCNAYQMVIPKACCNLSLASVSKVEVAPKLTTSVNGDSMTVCSDPGAKVMLTGPDGASKELPLDSNGCWTGEALAEGSYSLDATAECGVAAATATIAAAVVPPAPAPKKFIPFIAPYIGTETLMRYEAHWDMDMRDSSGIVGLRGGFKYALGKDLWLVPQLGIQHRTGVNEGNTYPDEGISLDVGIEKFVTDYFFIGAGIGIWDLDDSDFREESVFVNFGGKITPAMEWFLEARGIDSDSEVSDSFSDNHLYAAGIRFLF